jgi:aspartyl-tRNA synthetase
MNAFAQKEGLPGMGYIFWRELDEGGYGRVAKDLDGLPTGDGYGFPDDAHKDPNLLAQINSFGIWFNQRTGKWFEAAGPLAKNIGPERTEAIRQQLGLGVGDAAFFLGGKPQAFERVAGKARDVIGEELGLTETNRFAFAWIVDFPMYEADEETGKVDFSHNPFSMPQGGMEALNGNPLDVLGYQYDLACNGYELVSGAIRNHKPEIMFKAFELAGYGEDEVRKRFGGMVNAFQYGAPPHGGCAAGIDRIVMLLAGTSNIREVIMFPMNQRAEDLMMNAPSDPTSDQLMELGLRVIPQD